MMWKVQWCNNYGKLVTLVLSTRTIMKCLAYDHDYYYSIEPC
jgi:hypothetical protein